MAISVWTWKCLHGNVHSHHSYLLYHHNSTFISCYLPVVGLPIAVSEGPSQQEREHVFPWLWVVFIFGERQEAGNLRAKGSVNNCFWWICIEILQKEMIILKLFFILTFILFHLSFFFTAGAKKAYSQLTVLLIVPTMLCG